MTKSLLTLGDPMHAEERPPKKNRSWLVVAILSLIVLGVALFAIVSR